MGVIQERLPWGAVRKFANSKSLPPFVRSLGVALADDFGLVDEYYLKVVSTEMSILEEAPNSFAVDPLSVIGGRASLYSTLYIVMRSLRPERVVETGVARGLSSLVILAALKENGRGHLYSIDFPISKDWLGGSGTPGYLVKGDLKTKWSLILGKSSDKLPRLLAELGSIDVFFHDSNHSYENMKFEFATAWPFINREGLLVSDDVNSNSAFTELRDLTGGIGKIVKDERRKVELGILSKKSKSGLVYGS